MAELTPSTARELTAKAPKMPTMTQADYARHRGFSRQYINRLVQAERIALDAEGRIDPAQADTALESQADPARGMGDDGRRPPDSIGETPPAGQGAPGPAVPSFSEVRIRREEWKTKQAELDYKKQTGELLDRRETIEAAITAGRKIRGSLDLVPGMAAEITAAAMGAGEAGVKALLRRKVRSLEEDIAAALAVLGGGIEEGGP